MFKTIVVGTDGSRTAYQAVRTATAFAHMCSARLHIVTGYRPPADMSVIGPMGVALGAASEDDVRAEIELMLRDLEREVTAEGVVVSVHVVAARGADAILDVAEQEQADLIVLGNRGVQGSRPFLGSVPFSVLQHARCAVMVFPTSTPTDENVTAL
jgi:nucleotide-binding universal stress UspA family protein